MTNLSVNEMNEDTFVPKRPLYIAIEGPIGVGKTTLTNLLSEHLHARTVYEEFEENPFLRRFYEDRKSVAFQTQLFFLLCRFKQQQRLKQQDLFEQNIVSDYLFNKDRIFACINLDGDELMLYDRIFDIMSPRLTKPDLVVYLTAPLEVLFARIHKRGREYEQSIEPDYLSTLSLAYQQFFAHFDSVPVLKIDTSNIDIVSNLEDRAHVMEQVLLAVKENQNAGAAKEGSQSSQAVPLLSLT